MRLQESPTQHFNNLKGALTNPDGYITSSEYLGAGDHIGFNRNATVGWFIRLNYSKHITIVSDQMGQAPWYAGSDKVFIDNTGLTDKKIGHMDFSRKASDSSVFHLYQSLLVSLKGIFWPDEKHLYTKNELVDYLFSLQPELVLIRERYVNKIPNSVIGKIFHDERFEQRYRKVLRINKRDVLYERKDLPIVNEPVIPPGAMVEYQWEPKL